MLVVTVAIRVSYSIPQQLLLAPFRVQSTVYCPAPWHRPSTQQTMIRCQRMNPGKETDIVLCLEQPSTRSALPHGTTSSSARSTSSSFSSCRTTSRRSSLRRPATTRTGRHSVGSLSTPRPLPRLYDALFPHRPPARVTCIANRDLGRHWQGPPICCLRFRVQPGVWRG